MFKWLFHILIFATNSGKYQNKEKPLKRQRKLGLVGGMTITYIFQIPEMLIRQPVCGSTCWSTPFDVLLKKAEFSSDVAQMSYLRWD